MRRTRQTVIPVLMLCTAGCGDTVPAPMVDQFNVRAREGTYHMPAYGGGAFPAFRERFELVSRVQIPVGQDVPETVDGITRNPDLCAVTPSGDVYLSWTGSRKIYRLASGMGRPVSVNMIESDRPRGIIDLIWHQDRQASLYVLDGGRNQVRRYSPTGDFLGYIPLNAGQTNFRVALLPSGEYVLGGTREQSTARTTLISIHDAQGRHLSSVYDMDSLMVRSKLRSAPPVYFSLGSGENLIVAQPSLAQVDQVTSAYAMQPAFEVGFEGYRAPRPLVDVGFGFETAIAWTRSWDRLIFLHSGEPNVFTAFESWRGSRPSYRLEIVSPRGARVATNLRTDSMPLCAWGNDIVFISQGDPAQVELSRWRWREFSADRQEDSTP